MKMTEEKWCGIDEREELTGLSHSHLLMAAFQMKARIGELEDENAKLRLQVDNLNKENFWLTKG